MSSIHEKKLFEYLDVVLAQGATDLHINAKKPPMVRVDSILYPIKDEKELTPTDTKELIFSLFSEDQKKRFSKNKELDFAYSHGDKARFRVNAFVQQGTYSAALRLIPHTILSLQDLGLPEDITHFTDQQQGFVLVVGPTGHGKTTTLASMVNVINETRSDHIITIEDPIEYIFPQLKGLIAQREVYHDTDSFENALKASLREDPNVVLVGEMRDLETIGSALTLAETGHLVLSTLHTNDASQTIDRIIDVFPPYQQNQVRVQLASTLKGIISQRLIPKIGGGRIPAVEILRSTSAVQNLIREGKTHQINNIIQTGAGEGMVPLNRSLTELVKQKTITKENALFYSNNEDELKGLIGK
ncbi:type IV pilus twitching motility protein PilT [Patescibacteria group bacterium]|nr:type IV pilus twitching motility protein PilT [Patescibacteria group bacterium]